MNQDEEGGACPAYVNQDRGAVAEVVLPTAVPTLLQLMERRSLLAYRAMGVLKSLLSTKTLPEVHVEHVRKLVADFDKATEDINAEMAR